MKRALFSLMVALLCAFAAVFAACGEVEGTGYIKLNRKSLTLTCGEKFAIVAEVTSPKVTGVQWSSSDSSVAGVEDGLVTAYAAGNATIYASSDGKTAYCNVTVTDFSDGGDDGSDGNDDNEGGGDDGQTQPPDGGEDIPEEERGRAVHFVYFDTYDGGKVLSCLNSDGSVAEHFSGIALTSRVQTVSEGAEFGDMVFECAADMNSLVGVTVQCYGATTVTLYVSSETGTTIKFISPDGKKLYNFIPSGLQEATFVAEYLGVYTIEFGGNCLLYAVQTDGAAEGREDILPDENKVLSGIEIDTDSAKLFYDYGEPFSSDGVKVIGKYKCHAIPCLTKRQINSGVSFSGYDAFTTGEQIITVTFGGFSAEYVVTVAENVNS